MHSLDGNVVTDARNNEEKKMPKDPLLSVGYRVPDVPSFSGREPPVSVPSLKAGLRDAFDSRYGALNVYW